MKFHLIACGAEHALLFVLEISVERVGVLAVDVDLGEHRKAHAVILLAECADLAFAARLLMAELVAGKAQHGEAFA